MPSEENKKEENAILVPTEKDGKDEKNNKKDKAEELSEEDQALKEGLEVAVQRLQEEDAKLHTPALNHLANEIKSATSSMTSVPKPLKFLRPHYDALKTVYSSWEESHEMKPLLADVLSVLAMTMAEPDSRECLRFKLLGTPTDSSVWGHEYVRCLAGEIAAEYNVRAAAAEEELAEEEYVLSDELMTLVEDIVPFQMQHNAEAEAVDLLMEIRQLSKLVDSSVVDERNHERVCLYLLRSAAYVYDPEDLATLNDVIYHIYKTQNKFTDALRVALKIDDEDKVRQLFVTNPDTARPTETEKKQMALILGRHRSHISLGEEALDALVGNTRLSETYRGVARKMDLSRFKSPEEVIGGISATRKNRAAANDPFAALFGGNNNNRNGEAESAKGNLANSIVNAFVNAAHDCDAYMLNPSASTSSSSAASSSSAGMAEWLARNRGAGLTMASASLGLVSMWNCDEALNRIDPLLHHSDVAVQSGAVLAIGLASAGVRDEVDAAFALLSDYLTTENTPTALRQSALLGLGICYAGQRKEEVREVLEGIVSSESSFLEACLAALALGLVFSGTAHDELGSTLLQRMMEASETEMDQSSARLLVLGLALLFLGKGEAADPFVEALQTIEHRRGALAVTLLQTCAFAASGNVLKVQEMLRVCAEHAVVPTAPAVSTGAAAAAATNPLAALGGGAQGGGMAAALAALTGNNGNNNNANSSTAPPNTAEAKDAAALGERQGVCVLGIALIALGEEVGAEMCLRSFDHLLQYGDASVKRAVPLALALLHLSNPDYAIVDQLSRLSHEVDKDTARGAILGECRLHALYT